MLPFASVVTAGACVALALAVATPQVPVQAGGPSAPDAAQPAPAPPVSPAPDADFAQRIDRMLSAAWLADLYPFTRDPDVTDEGYQAALSMALRCARWLPQLASASGEPSAT